jgi:hypothetical protein
MEGAGHERYENPGGISLDVKMVVQSDQLSSRGVLLEPRFPLVGS